MGGAAVQTTRLYEVSVFELVRYWYHTDAKVFPLELILEDTIYGATVERCGSEALSSAEHASRSSELRRVESNEE